jgi:hypothetical protein
MRIAISGLMLLLLPGLACGSPAARVEDDPCTPSFLVVPSQGLIDAEVGTWRVLFKVALVGCAEDLEQLSQEDLTSLEGEFREPSKWSNLLLPNEADDPSFRHTVVQRIDEILERHLVTDVLFHDVTVLDHNVQ